MTAILIVSNRQKTRYQVSIYGVSQAWLQLSFQHDMQSSLAFEEAHLSCLLAADLQPQDRQKWLVGGALQLSKAWSLHESKPRLLRQHQQPVPAKTVSVKRDVVGQEHSQVCHAIIV